MLETYVDYDLVTELKLLMDHKTLNITLLST